MSQRIGIIVFVLAVVAGGWVRFDRLSLKPLHHDEGVNSFFLLNLARQGEYRYDPNNYHGPTLYYLGVPALLIFGENEFGLRFWPAAFGVMTIALLWPLRRRLGWVGMGAAAWLLALSPGLVYYSRDLIHETMFGCFSLAVVAGGLRFLETRQFRWLAMGVTAAGLLFATKETAVITMAVLVLAALSAVIWSSLAEAGWRPSRQTLAAGAREVRNWLPSLDFGLAALVIFIFVNLVFYTSLFRHWQGAWDAVRSLLLWTARSGSEHVKSFWYYGGLMLRMELPVLVAALVAGALLVRRATRFQLFIGAWTLGIFLAYSLIGYKTPWLIVSMLIPAAILGGEAVARIASLAPGRAAAGAVLVLLAAGLWFPARLTRQLNFEGYDDNNNPGGYLTGLGERLRLAAYRDSQYGYVYVQTSREVMTLVELIVEEVAKRPEGRETGILVATDEYWPLPWYLRDFPNVAWGGAVPEPNSGERSGAIQPLIVTSLSRLDSLVGLTGYRVSPTSYNLRPGASLALLVRDDQTGERPPVQPEIEGKRP